MNLGKYMECILERLEKEFERQLKHGFDDENKFYEYLNDLRVISRKLQK